jgi:EF-hand domain pair
VGGRVGRPTGVRRDEFDSLLKQVGIHVPEATVFSLFRRVDIDQDGYIGPDEFRIAFYSLGARKSDADDNPKADAAPGMGGFDPTALLGPREAFTVRWMIGRGFVCVG